MLWEYFLIPETKYVDNEVIDEVVVLSNGGLDMFFNFC